MCFGYTYGNTSNGFNGLTNGFNTQGLDFLGNGFGTSNNTVGSMFGNTSNGYNYQSPYGSGFNTNASGLSNLGLNLDTFKFGLGALTGLGQLYGGFQAANVANKQFDYAKKISDINLANQTKAYNTNLSDRATARYATENKSQSDLNNYIKNNSL